MPKMKQIEIYEFDELEPKAKEKAIRQISQDQLYGQIVIEEVSEYLIENLNEKLPWLEKAEIEWSFDSAPGVVFSGDVNITKLAKEEPKFKKFDSQDYHFGISIANRGSNYHTSSMIVTGEIYHYDRDFDSEEEALEEELFKYIYDSIKQTSSELKQKGYKAYDELLSDDVVSDYIKMNNFEFLKDGSVDWGTTTIAVTAKTAEEKVFDYTVIGIVDDLIENEILDILQSKAQAAAKQVAEIVKIKTDIEYNYEQMEDAQAVIYVGLLKKLAEKAKMF